MIKHETDMVVMSQLHSWTAPLNSSGCFLLPCVCAPAEDGSGPATSGGAGVGSKQASPAKSGMEGEGEGQGQGAEGEEGDYDDEDMNAAAQRILRGELQRWGLG